MFAKWLPTLRNVVFLCGIFFSTFLHAQQYSIEGRITSAYDNAPIEGVHVRLSDSTTVAISDVTGYFILEAPENSKLTFYYPATGLDSSIVSGNQFNYIHLKIDTHASSKLYGPASSSVYRPNLNQGVVAGPEQLIQGRIAGVQTTSASGDPGAFTYSIIRGVNSLYTNQPLIVLDGIPISMNQFSPASFDLGYGVKQYRNPLRYINPSDIQRIEVIKDGSSAMYGVRGGNGVILITTHDAGYKRHQFEYSSQLTVASVRKRLDLLDRQAFLKGVDALGGDSDLQDYHHDTDWQSEVLHRTISQKHDFSYRDRYKNGQLRASVGYEDQEGIVRQTSMKRISARLNMQHSFLKNRLALNAKLLFSRVTDEVAPITTNRFNLIESMISTNPTFSSSTSQLGGTVTPTGWQQHTRDQTFSNVYWTSLSAAYKLTKNFALNVNANIDGSASKRENIYSDLLDPSPSGELPIAMIQHLDITNNYLEGNLTYVKKLSKGVFTSVLGFSDQRFRNKKTVLAGLGFQSSSPDAITNDLRTAVSLLTSALPSSYYNFGYDGTIFFASFLEPLTQVKYTPPNGVPVASVVGSQSQTGNVLRSYFLRLGYEHQQKYFFTAGLRRDASNHFGDKYPAGYFPHATLAWIISNEDFFHNNSVYLKMRGSIGAAGNAHLLTNQTIRRTTYSDVRLSRTIQPPGIVSGLRNPDLRWETLTQSDLGFDFSLVNGRLAGTLDFYNKVTHNMLGYGMAAQPAVSSQSLQNLSGQVVNKGIELSLTYELLQRKNTSIALGTLFSYNSNKMKSFNGNLDLIDAYGQALNNRIVQRLSNHGPMYEYYLREFKGFDQNGQPIGDVQKAQNKSAIPKVNTGFTIGIKYNRFYLSTLLTGQFGHYLYNNTANNLLTRGALNSGYNITVEAESTKESGSAEAAVSTRFLEKANFLRLQQLIAGYRFTFAKGRIDQLQISAIAQNLFVITKYSGFDPEVNTSAGSNTNASYGIDYTSYPRARMFTLNVGIIF